MYLDDQDVLNFDSKKMEKQNTGLQSINELLFQCVEWKPVAKEKYVWMVSLFVCKTRPLNLFYSEQFEIWQEPVQESVCEKKKKDSGSPLNSFNIKDKTTSHPSVL